MPVNRLTPAVAPQTGFTFSIGGRIQNGTTIEHRSNGDLLCKSIELYCSIEANQDVQVEVNKNNVMVATAVLASGSKYVSKDLGAGFTATTADELTVTVVTTATVGTNLRVRVK